MADEKSWSRKATPRTHAAMPRRSAPFRHFGSISRARSHRQHYASAIIRAPSCAAASASEAIDKQLTSSRHAFDAVPGADAPPGLAAECYARAREYFLQRAACHYCFISLHNNIAAGDDAPDAGRLAIASEVRRAQHIFSGVFGFGHKRSSGISPLGSTFRSNARARRDKVRLTAAGMSIFASRDNVRLPISIARSYHSTGVSPRASITCCRRYYMPAIASARPMADFVARERAMMRADELPGRCARPRAFLICRRQHADHDIAPACHATRHFEAAEPHDEFNAYRSAAPGLMVGRLHQRRAFSHGFICGDEHFKPPAMPGI